MIIVIDDVLDEAECEALIDIYTKNAHMTHDFNGLRPLNLDNIEIDRAYVMHRAYRLERIARAYCGSHEIDWAEIFKRDANTWQDLHLDGASELTTLTSITYLNDNFNGGFTHLADGTQVKPKTGRTILFDGKKYVHGVSPVIGGTRYTLPIWYKMGNE